MSTASELSPPKAASPNILPDDKNVRRFVFIALLLIGLLGLSLRVYKLDASLWTDEMHTFDRGGGSFLFSLNVTAYPLINVLAHCARQAGDSAWILRLPALASGLISMGLGFILASRAANWRAGLLTALLMAISVSFVEYSQEARYYSHVALFVLAMAVFVDYTRCSNNPLPYIAVAIAVFFGCLTHLFFVPFALAFAAVSAGLSAVFLIWSYGVTYALRSIALVLVLASGFSAFFVTDHMQNEGENLLEQVAPAPLADRFGLETHGGPTATHAGHRSYTLYLDDYIGYLNELSGIYNPYAFFGMIAISILGWVAIAYRIPHLGLACLGMLMLFPLALTQITAPHWYTARYFVGNYALHVIGFAAGVSWLANAVVSTGGACLNKPSAALRQRVPANAASYGKAACVVAIGMVPYHGAFGVLQEYYGERPVQDWRGAAAYMAQDLYPEDVLLFAEHRGLFELTERGVDHYLRKIPGAPWPELTVQGRIETQEDLLSISETYRGSAKQLVTTKTSLARYEGDFLRALEQEFSGYEAFGNVVVFTDASPRHKVAGYEYVETEFDVWRSGGNVELFPSKRQVSFEGMEDEQTIVRVRFPERFELPVANSQFEHWEDGVPSAWSFEGGPKQIIEGEEEYGGGVILKGNGGPATLFTDLYYDVLHEGVSLEARIKATVTDDMEAALVIGPATGDSEAYLRRDIGSGDEAFTIEWSIEETMRNGGLRIGIETEESEEGYVQVDEVSVYANNPERRLTFFDQWTVAMDVKLEDVLPGAYPSRVFRSNVSGVDKDGEDYWIELHRSYGSMDWHRQFFLLEAGRTIPAGARNVAFRCGIWQGQGKAYIRDFRIVSGARPYRSSQ